MEFWDACEHCNGQWPSWTLPTQPVRGGGHSAALEAAMRNKPRKGLCPAAVYDCKDAQHKGACAAYRAKPSQRDADPSHPHNASRLFGPAPEYQLQLPTTGKKHAIFIGTGPSVNAITAEQFERLKPYADIWGLNLLHYHPVIVPDFWHYEPLSFSMPGGHALQHIHGYEKPGTNVEAWINHTVLICEQACHLLKHPTISGWMDSVQKRIYRRASISGCHTKCDPRDANYKPERDEVHIPCCSTMNRVMDLAARIGYKKVFLLGFDGSTDYYYTDRTSVPEGPARSVPMWALEAADIDETAPKALKGGGVEKEHPNKGTDVFIKTFAAFNGIQVINPESQLLSDGAKAMGIDGMLAEFEHGC